MQTLKTLLSLLILSTNPLFAQQKQVCFSIDDLPVVNYGINTPEFHNQITDKLLSGLKKYDIQAIGFVNEGKMYDAKGKVIAFKKANLEKWLKYGMDLGNHTLFHKDFNNVDFSDYMAKILKGEKITKALLRKYNKEMKYFRHPFLHVGATKNRADSLENFLKKHNYITAPVTIDNEDYLFANAYQKALIKKDTVLAQTIGKDYISYMEQKIFYYEKMSHALFGRQIPQILLIHANLLNADYIQALAEIYTKNGYKFTSMDQTMADEAYKTPITKFGRCGISWLDRWAISQGKTGDFFKGDPETPKYVTDISNQR
ncbi:polysaccharide deacetylase-like protein [Lacihabitans soyangensis]|uniref:Polysaccharide deacetylase-like protein n=2 Tax=Lacihabitans soyangensis TaxID=869394 RepID=A0AAE3GYZ0_9BACT|nr:polysaccharide deacetylase-like protein [Lacihabitans soyangensis]